MEIVSSQLNDWIQQLQDLNNNSEGIVNEIESKRNTLTDISDRL